MSWTTKTRDTLITSYETDVGRFIIRLPSSWALRQARQAFSYSLRTLVRTDGVPNVVAYDRSPTVRLSDGRIQADPDNIIVPMSRVRSEAGATRNVLSVVNGVARAQNSPDVSEKAKLWFRTSEGASKIVLFVDVSGSPPGSRFRSGCRTGARQ